MIIKSEFRFIDCHEHQKQLRACNNGHCWDVFFLFSLVKFPIRDMILFAGYFLRISEIQSMHMAEKDV